MSTVQIALAATTRIVQAVLRATDEKALLEEACSIIVDVGYGFCWVGEAEHDEQKTVRPLAWAGHEDGYLSTLKISWGDSGSVQSPASLTIRTARPVVIPDINNSSEFSALLREAAHRGYRSFCVLPLMNAQTPFAILCIYSTQLQAFDEQAMQLLSNLAEVLSFGVMRLRNRRQAEGTVRESRQRLDFALQGGELGTWDWYPQTGASIYSELWARTLGYRLDEVEPNVDFFEKHVHPGDLLDVLDRLKDHLEGRSPVYESEHQVRTKSGNYIWVLDRGKVAERDPQGRAVRVTGVISDITKRKEAEESLRKIRERLDFALQGGELGIWDWDPQTGQSIYSELWAGMLGYRADEIEHNVEFFKQHVHPDDLPNVLERLNEHLEGRAPVYESEHRLRTKSENFIWVLDRGKIAEQDPQGRPLRVTGVISDITKRKLADEKLRQQAQIMDQIHDAVVATDLNGVITRWNGGAERIFGYTAEEAAGQHITLIYPPDEHRFLQSLVIEPLQAKGWHEIEVRAVTKFGERLHIHLLLSLLKDSAGNVTGMIGNSVDITERKQAEEKFRKNENLLLQSQRIAHIGSWSFDLSTQTVAWTAETYSIYGVSPNTFTPSVESLMGLVHPDDRPAMQAWIAAAAGQPAGQLEFRAVRPDGSIRILSGQGELIPGAGDGNPLLVGTAQDITERKRAEEALRASESQHRDLIENAVYGIFVSRLAGKFDEVNPALVAMLGYSSKEELLALDPSTDVYCRAEDRATIIAQIRRTKVLQGVEVEWKRKDAAVILVRLSGRIVEIAKGGPYRAEVIVENVTEARKLEQQLRQAQKMEAVGRLAGGVAHDFNNLLAVMLGQCELIAGDLDFQTPLRRQIEVISGAGSRAAELTRQLLAFSRQQVLQPKFLDLNANVQGMATLLGRLIGEHITLETRLSRDLGQIKADPGQIEQVITNVVLNARDAMPQGGTLLLETSNQELFETLSEGNFTVPPGRYVTLAVTDTGVGMDKETIARIFEPFYTTKEIGKGTGLGLATVEGIVSQSGGHIAVRSVPVKGTTFSIYLPRVSVDVLTEKKESSALVKTARGETILLVEDEAVLREMMRSCLDKAGYNVLAAAHADEALQIAAQQPGKIHLLLTDVVMPGLDGAELARRLWELCPAAKVLYVSGYKDTRVLATKSPTEEAAFLEKPFQLHALTRKISELLAQSPQ